MGPPTSFRPYFLLGFDPLIWGLSASVVAGVLTSLATAKVDEAIVADFFDAEQTGLDAHSARVNV
jgi:SSS family solute:Na+ symporter/sodium/pantothenate symporter